MKETILKILNATHEDMMATEALDAIAARIEAALQEDRGNQDCAAGNHAYELRGKVMKCVRCGEEA